MTKFLMVSALLAASVGANAATIQITVTGAVRADSYAPIEIPAGSVMTMTYQYSDDAPDNAPEWQVGSYALDWLSVTLNDFSYTYHVGGNVDGSIQVAVNYFGINYRWGPISVVAAGWGDYPAVPILAAINYLPPEEMEFAPVFSPPLTSDALVLPPAGWGGAMDWTDDSNQRWSISAPFTASDVQVQVVPIPGGLWLFASGILTLFGGGRAWRKTR